MYSNNENLYNFNEIIKQIEKDAPAIIDWFTLILEKKFSYQENGRIKDNIFFTEELGTLVLYIYSLYNIVGYRYESLVTLRKIIKIIFEFDRNFESFNKAKQNIRFIFSSKNVSFFNDFKQFRRKSYIAGYLPSNIRDTFNYNFSSKKFNIFLSNSYKTTNIFLKEYFSNIIKFLKNLNLKSIEKYPEFLLYFQIYEEMRNDRLPKKIPTPLEIYIFCFLLPFHLKIVVKNICTQLKKKEIFSSTPIIFTSQFEKVDLLFRISRKPKRDLNERVKEWLKELVEFLREIKEETKP